jgi:predicted RNase H-like HicB family nuclease
MRRYAVVLTPEAQADGYSVSVPALPGCVSQGDSFEDALANIREAIGLCLGVVLRDGEDLPEDVVSVVTAVDAEPLAVRRPSSEELAAIDQAPRWDGRTW